jgi:hypothetical protein
MIVIMKKLSLIMLFCAAIGVSFAQKNQEPVAPDLPIDEDTKLITYQEVIQEKGTAQELYDRALVWTKSFYKNTAEVIRSADTVKKELNIYSSVRVYSHQKDGSKLTKNIVYYNFKLECKEGRYRYTITDFNYRATAAAPIEIWLDKTNKKWDPECFVNLQEVDEQIQALLSSLVDGMQPPVVKNDEW